MRKAILNQAQLPGFRITNRTSLLAGGVALLLSGIMAAFGTAPGTVTYSGQLDQVLEEISVPNMYALPAPSDAHAREIRIYRGDTVSSLLSRLNIRDDTATDFIRASRDVDIMSRQLVPGKTVTAFISPSGTLQSLIFPLNGGRDTALTVERTPSDGSFSVKTAALQLESKLSLQTAVIRHSLFGAADDAGIPESVATQLADIFGGDIDFHRDLRKGDRFSVIYETVTHLGKPVRAERILAAEFSNGGKTHQAFWYAGKNGGSYYDAEGRSLKKAFLRSPLEFSRITSGFSNARYHPVLQEVRAHRGIDYAAPTGTRVRATGSGVVDFAGIQGGYGKVVILRHPGDRTTVYGHLSSFSAGIHKGAKVVQGEAVGHVGATGLATGPHLHYEFRINGVHRNPLTIALPDAGPLPLDQIGEFRSQAGQLSAQISTIRDSQLVLLD